MPIAGTDYNLSKLEIVFFSLVFNSILLGKISKDWWKLKILDNLELKSFGKKKEKEFYFENFPPGTNLKRNIPQKQNKCPFEKSEIFLCDTKLLIIACRIFYL